MTDIIDYMDMKDVEILPESPFKKKVLEIQEGLRKLEIDRNNMLLRFIIAKIPPDKYMKLVKRGYGCLRDEIIELDGFNYIKGHGFHPYQYGCNSCKQCGVENSCNKHHQMFIEKILELYSDKEYAKECKEFIKLAAKKEQQSPSDEEEAFPF